MPSDYWDTGEWSEYDNRGFGAEYGGLYDDLMGDASHGGWEDDFAKMLFDIGYVHGDEQPDVVAAAREMLNEWLADEYDIEFEAEFDWDTWRELYGGG